MTDSRIGLAATALLLVLPLTPDAQRRAETRRPADDSRSTPESVRPTSATAGTPIDLGFASDPIAIGGPWVVFERSEVEAGDDLNGDGDQIDLVVAVWNADSGQLMNTGLERSGAELFVPFVDEDRVFLFTDEAFDQIDHDGDGNETDVFLGLFDAQENQGDHVETLVDRFIFNPVGAVVEVVGDMVAIETPESVDPPRDWNGDGDTIDIVVRLLHFGDSNRLSPPNPLIPRTTAGPLLATICCGEELVGPSWFELTPDYLFVSTDEEYQGNTDLDGSGTVFGNVVMAVSTRTEAIHSLGINSTEFRAASNRFLGVVGHESHQAANVDLNGDSDTNDLIFFQVDMETGVQDIVPLSLSPFTPDSYVPTVGDRALLWVREASQGDMDLNGDGDALDTVLHVRDLNARTTTNTGLTPFTVRTAGNALIFSQRETSQGNTDLNGDSDTDDHVLFRYDLQTGAVTNLVTAVVSNRVPPASERLAAIYVSEADQSGFDFNFDTDGNDSVISFYDGASDTFTNAALALDSFNVRVAGCFAAFLVSEAGQGNTDLNGDLDTNDAILHLYDADLGTSENLGLEADDLLLSEDVLAFTSNGTLHVLALD